MIDSHCHLVSPKLKDQVADLVQRAKNAGVSHIINIAYNLETADVLEQQLQEHPLLAGTLGIQPHDAKEHTIEIGEILAKRAQDNSKIVGIGEIGLDYHYTLSEPAKQIECFEHFLDIAVRLKLPVVVHMRDSHDDVLSRLQSFSKKGLTGVIHCFTGSWQQGMQYLDCGFYLSFSGIVTFKNADDVRQVVRQVPMDKFLIETDSPYLAPIPQRGKTNEPAFVKHVCETVAELKGLSFEECARQSLSNTRTLFSKLT